MQSNYIFFKDHVKIVKIYITKFNISILDRLKTMFFRKYKVYTGWSTKMSLFFFGNNFYKNKETFKIFSPQSLDVYRILLVETTLESIMFYYTFSVINNMFVPYTALLYDSTAATRTLKLSTTLLRIWREMSLYHGKLCLRHSSVLFDKWHGALFLKQNTWIPQT